MRDPKELADQLVQDFKDAAVAKTTVMTEEQFDAWARKAIREPAEQAARDLSRAADELNASQELRELLFDALRRGERAALAWGASCVQDFPPLSPWYKADPTLGPRPAPVSFAPPPMGPRKRPPRPGEQKAAPARAGKAAAKKRAAPRKGGPRKGRGGR